ncbi:MAG: transporter, partial [Chthonomonadaceae bacterium]|nr:transporter [Chthonomonadaceae bacterium]
MTSQEVAVPTAARSPRPRVLRRGRERRVAELVAVAAIAIGVSLGLGGSDYDQLILELIAVYAIAATGLNIAVGLTGQFQMAQVGCMAVSAYASSILAVDHAYSPWIAMGAGVLMAVAFGAIVGLVTARTRSHYLLLVTFALQVVAVNMIRNLSGLTGGVNGHAGIFELPFPGGSLMGATVEYSILTLLIAGAGMLLASWLGRSYTGVGMQGSRQSEPAELASGLSPARFRLLAILISAAYAGVAGALIGPVLTNLVPASFGLGATLLLLVIVVTGGMGSPVGTVIAAAALTWANQVAQGRTTAWPLIYGVLVMVILVVAPGGLASIGRRAGRLWPRGSTPAP